MHDIEPYYRWRDQYASNEDDQSPFYGVQHDEFRYTNKVYNYLIHPQWDDFGSPTLYTKLIFADYDDQFAILEFIGEWNDCVTNDVMHLKRNVVDPLIDRGIRKFVVIGENVLNFHGSDECYYEEWRDDVFAHGWIAFVNVLDHVEVEMCDSGLSPFVHFGGPFNGIDWRAMKPRTLVRQLQELMVGTLKYLP